MNNTFGQSILEEIKKFENSKVSNIRKNTYEITMPKFTAEIHIDDEGYHKFELTLDDYYWASKELKRQLCFHIDNDGGHDPDMLIAKSIEQDIVETLKALRTDKILLGERKGYAAMVIPQDPQDDPFVMVASGRFFDFLGYFKSLDEVREKGKFIQRKQS